MPDLLDNKDHRVPKVSQVYLEILAIQDQREILEILVSRASEESLVMRELWDTREFLVREVNEGSQVQEATLDNQVHLVTLEDRVQLAELEQLELLDSLDRMDFRETLDR